VNKRLKRTKSLKSFDLNGLRGYLVYIVEYRIYKGKGVNEEARKSLEAIERIYTEEIT